MKLISIIIGFFQSLLKQGSGERGEIPCPLVTSPDAANNTLPGNISLPLIRIALDIGHKYKISNPDDRGAKRGDLVEADIAETYVHLARRYLNGSRIEGAMLSVFIPSPSGSILVGEYSDRHKWANNSLVDLYVQAHVNAGGGSYAWLGHNGLGPSREIAKVLGNGLVSEFSPEINKYTLVHLSSGERGWTCIKGVSCPAIIYEPCFLDNPIHARGLRADWIERIAKTLSNSIKGLILEGVINGNIRRQSG